MTLMRKKKNKIVKNSTRPEATNFIKIQDVSQWIGLEYVNAVELMLI